MFWGIVFPRLLNELFFNSSIFFENFVGDYHLKPRGKFQTENKRGETTPTSRDISEAGSWVCPGRSTVSCGGPPTVGQAPRAVADTPDPPPSGTGNRERPGSLWTQW